MPQTTNQMLANIRGRLTAFETHVESTATYQERVEQKLDALTAAIEALPAAVASAVTAAFGAALSGVAQQQQVQSQQLGDVQANLLNLRNAVGDPAPDDPPTENG